MNIYSNYGQQTSNECGGHIHIGADYLKSKEAYINLYEIWGNAEEILYKISNEKDSIPRMYINTYARPISSNIKRIMESGTITLNNEQDLDKFIDVLQSTQKENKFETRNFALNLLNINNGKNTIEFRLSNGSLNPDTWIENIRLYGRIVQIAEKLAEIQKQATLSESDQRLLNLMENLKSGEKTEQEKMEILLEMLFDEEEREVYRERYFSCSELLTQLPYDENSLYGFKFPNSVNFKANKDGNEYER